MSLGYATPETEIRPYLDAGERLLWAGAPIPGLSIRLTDLGPSIGGLFFTGFSIFWISMASMGVRSGKGTGPFMFFPLFGVPFLCVGLYILVGRFFFDARRRRTTFYGITDRRILIVSGRGTKTTRSLPLKRISDTTFTEYADGSGNIMLSTPDSTTLPSTYPNGRFRPAGFPAPISFERLPNVREVHQKLTQAQAGAA